MDRVKVSPFKLIVRSLIGAPINGIQQCTIDSDNFNLCIGKVSQLIPVSSGTEAGSKVRKFVIDGVEVYSSWKRGDYNVDPESGSRFFMATDEAIARHEPYEAPAKATGFGLSAFLAQNKKALPVV